ncbi:streptomycin 3-adenylyltransferase [Butyrivibrio sp. ob235]|uniref:aminoglycoside adenylyltransferase domain-containing protein n=1 Tax=Butyrivibrio sp. ob235 TaxID=1761780 RepID=UPI0008D047C9|nr:aminoglycoside adenylyltransferase domain-containing protein [Butyrivibrio sp. ob235]SEL44397.1 streptomycin 3-adenylyltransferase [Butyrivibrio sp. ob235]
MKELLYKFVRKSREILQDNLTGIYLHGSAVMGCFNPEKSDLDLIVVVNEPVQDDVKRRFMDMVVEVNEEGPAKGIEMSIVTKNVCKPFVYPTPFELHFSEMHKGWYRDNPKDYILKMKGSDKDLAAHFTIISKRGKCLLGLPIEDVFEPVPKADYLDSIWEDIAEAQEDIIDSTMYTTLNLARVLAYRKEELILSKKEGGEWALDNVPEEYHTLIRAAMCEYADAAKTAYDHALAKRYAEYMLREIQN